MIEGQPFVLVIGGADTGRSPLVAALLRRALPGVQVRSAGVLSHDGDPAANEVALALEQMGVLLGEHYARSLDPEEVRQADLLLGVDRGTARVLQVHYPGSSRIAALSDLARMSDVIDPHRMPLGLWITAARDLDSQISAALPTLRERLPLANATTPTAPPPAPPAAAPAPLPPIATIPTDTATDRVEPLARITRLLETAQVLPEIVDWDRLRSEVSERLKAIAAVSAGPTDFTPAATMMIDGLLSQTAMIPPGPYLERLRAIVQHLAQPLDGTALAALAGEVATWTNG